MIDSTGDEAADPSRVDPAAISLPPTVAVELDVARLLQAHARMNTRSGFDSSTGPALTFDELNPLLAMISRSVRGALQIIELPHYRILVLLTEVDSAAEGELTALSGMSTRTMGRLLDVMEASGWVTVVERDSPGLNRAVSATVLGREIVRHVTDGRQQEIDDLVVQLSPAQRELVARAFARFAEAAAEPSRFAPEVSGK